ncbi:MAG: succinylglutamate desuccinylase/aspartoacylase family protein [Synergistaceae bacterium]|jgi:hypothetical protein|nr:succinylglutamate desuccinylase/aspartoacylase family protein [Synergistaceae bacterium]
MKFEFKFRLECDTKGTNGTAWGLLLCALAVAWLANRDFAAMKVPDTIIPAANFEEHLLSEWFAPLAGMPLDTPVYVQNGKEPGGSVLVLGGTHPNEPAGYMTAVLLTERARVRRGKLCVIPFANRPGFGHTQPQEASPETIHFTLPDGSTRAFRYGSRDMMHTLDWPVPDIYIHRASGQRLSGNESRNLNRAYPGVPDGTPTERLAWAIMEFLRKEKIDLAFDLHEASPEYPVVDAIVAHEKSIELAAATAMELKGRGIEIRLEPSPKNLRGLSHREWGDFSDTLPILMEVANPSQGRLRGRTDEALALTGKDRAYAKAAGLGRLFVPWDENGKPLDMRVARHLTAIMTFLSMMEFFVDENKVIEIDGLPAYQELVDQGIGKWLTVGNTENH